MLLGLRTNSATWLERFRIKSSAMDTWYLVPLITHLNWPEFLENFLVSWSLQQFQVKPSMNTWELKWLSLWQATAEYLQKWNLVCSPHVLIEPKIEQSLIIEVEEKPYCSSVSIVWWHRHRGYKRFSKQSTWRYWPKKLLILTKWGTCKKLMLIEGCWPTSLTWYLTTLKLLIGELILSF